MPDWNDIATAVREAGGPGLVAGSATRVGGGCIHATWRVETENGPCFVKLGGADFLALFQAEARGLEALAGARAIRVPCVLCCAAATDEAVLVLEWIDLRARTPDADARLGVELARQHGVLGEAYGWECDNALGSTPQPNGWQDDWVAFFRDRRLGYQLELAARNGYGVLAGAGDRLLGRLAAFFPGERPPPSLLHGDLWGGNAAADAAGRPVIFDPAVYYGDRAADIAMTRLFGGFGESFHAAYADAWPLAEDQHARVDVYNLYHVLNHLNLFGPAYLGRAERLLRSLLARVG